jgi:hypothetical protein
MKKKGKRTNRHRKYHHIITLGHKIQRHLQIDPGAILNPGALGSDSFRHQIILYDFPQLYNIGVGSWRTVRGGVRGCEEWNRFRDGLRF